MKILLLVIVLISGPALATSAPDQQALKETQQLLKSPAERTKAITGDKKAEQADAYTKEILGEHSEEAYAISADVLEVLFGETGGDPEKMNAILEKAARDPASFYKGLPPEIRKKISDVSQKAKHKGPAAP